MQRLFTRRFLTRRLSWLALLGAIAALLFAACGDSNGERSALTDIAVAEGAPSPPTIAPAEFDDAFPPAQGFEVGEEQVLVEARAPVDVAAAALPPPGGDGAPGALQVVERQIISVGSIALEVEEVRPAVAQVQQLAESLDGFVEQLNVFGDDRSARAEITIRVPQDAFTEAFDRLRRLGEVRGETVSSQDVTEQFIDLEARLGSAENEEESLLRLLERTNTVSEILTIERELTRIRSEIERLRGQLNFLERRVALTTINVSIFTAEARITEPPSASLTLEVSNVTRTVDSLRDFVASLDGVVARVIINVNEDEDFAAMTVRVPRAAFAQALASIEGRGEVITKQVREGEGSFDPDAPLLDEPDARIDLQIMEEEGGSDAGLIVAIVVPSVAFAFMVVTLAIAFLRRRRAAPAA